MSWSSAGNDVKSVDGLAYLTAEEMREVDRIAIEDFGIDVLSLMENAGLATATLARRMLGGHVSGRRITCLVGKGNNGGDGLVAARHLHNWGGAVKVVLCEREELAPIPMKQLEAAERMGLAVRAGVPGNDDSDLLVDALLGYNSRGDPREPVAGLIRDANASGAPILAVDIPSGLETTTGEGNDPCIVAEATLTLGFLKTGFLNPKSERYVGKLYVGDVSIPPELYRRYSQDVDLFKLNSIVRVDRGRSE